MSAERFIINALPDFVPAFLIKPEYVAAYLARNAECLAPDPDVTAFLARNASR